MKDITVTMLVSQGDYPDTEALPELTQTIIITKEVQESAFDKRNTLKVNINQYLAELLK